MSILCLKDSDVMKALLFTTQGLISFKLRSGSVLIYRNEWIPGRKSEVLMILIKVIEVMSFQSHKLAATL